MLLETSVNTGLPTESSNIIKNVLRNKCKHKFTLSQRNKCQPAASGAYVLSTYPATQPPFTPNPYRVLKTRRDA